MNRRLRGIYNLVHAKWQMYFEKLTRNTLNALTPNEMHVQCVHAAAAVVVVVAERTPSQWRI